MSRQWIINLPYQKPPLSLNDRMHWRKKAKIAKEIRTYVYEECVEAVPVCGAAFVELHYVPRDARRRDRDNLVPTLKHAIDGMVDAGVVEDDDHTHMDWRIIIDAPNRVNPHLYLVIKEQR